MEGGAIAWGDYDNDGDLDILRAGNWYNDDLSLIYRNNINDIISRYLRQWLTEMI